MVELPREGKGILRENHTKTTNDQDGGLFVGHVGSVQNKSSLCTASPGVKEGKRGREEEERRGGEGRKIGERGRLQRVSGREDSLHRGALENSGRWLFQQNMIWTGLSSHYGIRDHRR